MGIVRPGDMGFDIVHLNLHKTFSTPPHGARSESALCRVRKEELAQFLPSVLVEKEGDALHFTKPENSIGEMKSFYGNFLVVVGL